MSQQTDSGTKTFTSGEALAANRLVRLSGATSRTVVYADAGEEAIGVTQDGVADAKQVSVKLLQGSAGTFKVSASAATTLNERLYAADDGQVSGTEAGAAIFNGLEAASGADAVIEALPRMSVSASTSLTHDWMESVIDRVTVPTGSEAVGTRYLVITAATGVFAGQEDSVAELQTDATWTFITPTEGGMVEVEDENTLYYYDGSSWTTTLVCTAITAAAAITAATLTDGTVSLTAGTVTGALDISGATVTYRAIARTDMAEEALAIYQIGVGDYRNDDGTVIDATGGAGLFSVTSGAMGTGTLTLDGEAASGNSKSDTVMFEFSLPPEYMAAGDVRLTVDMIETVGVATTATTFSVEVYEDTGRGAVGSDLSGSPDVTDITDSWQTSTTVITAAGLLAGDKLRVFLRIVTNDTSGSVGTVAQIGKVALLCDIKG